MCLCVVPRCLEQHVLSSSSSAAAEAVVVVVVVVLHCTRCSRGPVEAWRRCQDTVPAVAVDRNALHYTFSELAHSTSKTYRSPSTVEKTRTDIGKKRVAASPRSGNQKNPVQNALAEHFEP